jgi:phosphoribosylanthranilate isomerase
MIPRALIYAWILTASIWGREFHPAPKPELVAKPEIITNATLDLVQQILQQMGFECTQTRDDHQSEPYLIFRAEGYKVVAAVPSPEIIWLYNVFSDKLTLENINEWNQNNRFSRASVPSPGKRLLLDTDIVVAGGVTRENIEAQIREFRNSVARWARFVLDHKLDSDDSPQGASQ